MHPHRTWRRVAPGSRADYSGCRMPSPLAWRPMPLLRVPEAFDHPEWLFELKHDGFRALAIIERDSCRLVSRNGHTFAQWPHLCRELAHTVNAECAVLDGE